MGWKDQKRKEIATCGKFVSPKHLLWASCCWDAQGISCSFLCHCNPTAHNVMCMVNVQLQRTAWNVVFHMKQGNYCELRHLGNQPEICVKSTSVYLYCLPCMWATRYSRFLHISPSFSKKIIKIPLENPCTWVATLSTIKSVTNTFIAWSEKTKKENKKKPVGSLFLLNICCEQAVAGMLRAFPVHFVPLQSNSTQPNMHDSHADTKNYMKYGFSYETDILGKLL